MPMTVTMGIKRYLHGSFEDIDDAVAIEHRANILVNGEHYITLMCSPNLFEELAVGFLFSEGVISAYSDIRRIDSTCTGYVMVELRSAPKVAGAGKRVLVSGCAGGSVNLSFLNRENLGEMSGRVSLDAEELCRMMAGFSRRSPLFEQTGGVHSCALEFPGGEGLFCEDIARHNAIDKIVGTALIRGIDIGSGLLVASGRVSSEILLKTARLGISMLVSRSAPTEMAVEIARKINMTLVGFARGGKFNVYSGAFRITGDSVPGPELSL